MPSDYTFRKVVKIPTVSLIHLSMYGNYWPTEVGTHFYLHTWRKDEQVGDLSAVLALGIELWPVNLQLTMLTVALVGYVRMFITLSVFHFLSIFLCVYSTPWFIDLTLSSAISVWHYINFSPQFPPNSLSTILPSF